MNLQELVRKNIWAMKPYSSARDEFKGEASVYLDANENPLNDKFNRYPDPMQWELKEKIARIKGVEPTQIFLGNGSDEPIDLVIRIFCEPRIDNVLAIDPTYGMYQVCANTNDVEYRKVLLNEDYSMNAEKLLTAIDDHTKLIFICSPNNPTANLIDEEEIRKVLTEFKGIVVLDEAYIDFSDNGTWLKKINEYPNLIILQTFSKAWGLAAVRLGMAFAAPDIIKLFNKVKYPYNVNALTQNYVIQELDKIEERKEWIKILINGRNYLTEELAKLPYVKRVYPSDANFILVKVEDATDTYNKLAQNGVIVRNRHTVSLCEDCLRITVGTDKENKILIDLLQNLYTE